jgi:hypothetical protein
VEAKIDLQGDYYSPLTGKGAGYELRFRAIRDDGRPSPQLKLIVVGTSLSKKYGEAGDSVVFVLASQVPLDGVLHTEDFLSYEIVAHANSP